MRLDLLPEVLLELAAEVRPRDAVRAGKEVGSQGLRAAEVELVQLRPDLRGGHVEGSLLQLILHVQQFWAP